jgi:membrane fusion protein (multidrug efflux system)
MYVEVTVVLPQRKTVVAVPATAVVHASFGDSVFVVEDEKDAGGNVVMGPDGKPMKSARQQFVRLAATRGDFAAIAEGVKPGDEVVVGGAFKLRNRSRIAVHNEVELHPELQPQPPNR